MFDMYETQLNLTEAVKCKRQLLNVTETCLVFLRTNHADGETNFFCTF
jgi:hypothetical protein